jgi:hypothetical protein
MSDEHLVQASLPQGRPWRSYPIAKAQRPYAFDLLNSLMAVVPTTEKTREMDQSFENEGVETCS